MSIKTNKSYTKRLKVTRRGKVLARKSGQNHFNAKESVKKQMTKKRKVEFPITNKEKSLFLPNVKNK